MQMTEPPSRWQVVDPAGGVVDLEALDGHGRVGVEARDGLVRHLGPGGVAQHERVGDRAAGGEGAVLRGRAAAAEQVDLHLRATGLDARRMRAEPAVRSAEAPAGAMTPTTRDTSESEPWLTCSAARIHTSTMAAEPRSRPATRGCPTADPRPGRCLPMREDVLAVVAEAVAVAAVLVVCGLAGVDEGADDAGVVEAGRAGPLLEGERGDEVGLLRCLRAGLDEQLVDQQLAGADRPADETCPVARRPPRGRAGPSPRPSRAAPPRPAAQVFVLVAATALSATR